MSTKFKIDTKRRIAFVKRFGRISNQELSHEMEKITSQSDYKGVDKLLSDLSESDLSGISTRELELHANLCEDKFKDLTAVALVAPDDLSFGISRMFKVLSNLENVKVFRKKEDALDWLDIHALPDEF